jgi:hypothetical protein
MSPLLHCLYEMSWRSDGPASSHESATRFRATAVAMKLASTFLTARRFSEVNGARLGCR